MSREAAQLFAGAAPYYARYRPSYPPALFDHLQAHFGLAATAATAVDLGCGTGQLAIPLAARGLSVIAIDPSPEMLAEARRAATAAGVATRIRFVAGVGEDLPSLVQEPVALMASAAAFHWMDRERVLGHCDRLVVPGGGVAIIAGAPSVWSAGADWAAVIVEVIREFLGPERRAGSGTYRDPPRRHEEVLAGSPFSMVTHWQQPQTYVRDVDELIGLQLSTSHATPALLGDRREAFVARLRQRLLEAVPEGRFMENVMLDAYCARRPASAGQSLTG
jgi:SAM-dependent methyltransferase